LVISEKAEAVLWKEIGCWKRNQLVLRPSIEVASYVMVRYWMEFQVWHLAYTNLSKPDQACIRPVRKGLKLLYKAPNPLSTDYRLLSKDWRNARVRGGWCLVLTVVDWFTTMDSRVWYWYWCRRSEHVIRCCIEHCTQTQVLTTLAQEEDDDICHHTLC
jgi:hypothetical protein